VSNNTALTVLAVRDNRLTALDVSNNAALRFLICRGNRLTALDVSNNAALEMLRCDDNRLTGIALNAAAPYSYINVSYNYMENTDAVTGRAITWDGVNFIFFPQNNAYPTVVTDDKTAVVAAPEGEDTAFIPNNVLNQIRQGTLQLEIGFADEDGEAVGTMVFSAEAAGKMISDATGGGINVSLKTVGPEDLDLSGLSEEEAEAVAGRPVYEFTVTDANNRPITQFGGNVTITLPYTLAEGENPNAIIIYYLTDEGIKIVRGYYDAAAQTVIITTNHFSKYVVGYNDVTFTDVPKDHPNKAAIDFLAAREITVGYGGGIFGLNDELTRAQLLVMVLKAYGIEEDKTLENTFDDAEGKWFEYWTAMAKDLGITAGVGNNNFGEEPAKFEQVLLWIYRTLDAIGETLPDAETVKLAGFAGADTFSDWVWLDGNDRKLEAVLEAVGFDGDDLDPQGYCERALMAQLLYNMMTR
jgi:hypothetical protein